MPHVTISLYPGHSQDEKVRLSEKVRDDVVSVLGADIKAVSVSIREVSDKNWRQVVYDKEIYSDEVELHVKPGYLFE